MPDERALNELSGLPLRDALEQVLSAMEAQTGTIHRLGPDGMLHLEEHAGSIPASLLPVIGRIPVGKGMAGLAAERGVPVQVCNLQADASGDVRPGARVTGMRGSICVPMKKNDKLAGVLGVAVASRREFSEAETGWLTQAGVILAKALEKS